MLKKYLLSIMACASLMTGMCLAGGRFKRIVGGEDVDIEKVPFVGSLEYINGPICGVSILNNEWVITAAHCFGKIFRPDLALIRVGSGERQRGGTEHTIAAILKFPHFQLKVVDNDVALIKLRPPVEFSDKVRPIEIPQSSEAPQVGDMLTILGWGYTKEKGEPSQHLKAVEAPVFPHEECKQIYNATLEVTKQMMCVGFREGGKDACVLDSGGPLVKNDTLVGLVSWGWGCARALRPGVYTDLSVDHVRNWIRSVLQTS